MDAFWRSGCFDDDFHGLADISARLCHRGFLPILSYFSSYHTHAFYAVSRFKAEVRTLVRAQNVRNDTLANVRTSVFASKFKKKTNKINGKQKDAFDLNLLCLKWQKMNKEYYSTFNN